MKATPNLGRILSLMVFMLVASALPARAQSWVATGSMSVARADHTATLLTDGRVLVAGARDGRATAELYNPATGTWLATGSMSVARAHHTATLLNDGRLLVAGGDAGGTAELYDPATGTWIPTGSMSVARWFHSATLLADGRVLVAGSGGGTTAELYDPATGTWSATGGMSVWRAGHTATLLNDGRVLVAGGGTYDGSPTPTAELYDPATGTWVATGSMSVARVSHTATRLDNGTVLVAGDGNGPDSATAELYDPTTGAWRLTTTMSDARLDHTATRLGNGRVLVAGGALGCPPFDPGLVAQVLPQLNSAEEYDPVIGTWVARTFMQTGRYLHTATLLTDGRVLVAGGISGLLPLYDENGDLVWCVEVDTAAVEVYYPAGVPPDTEPPDTSIVSVVDGNGAAVADGGTTVSNAITFSFSGTDNVGVAGFECQLDNAGFIPCTNPVTYSGLALGRHEFAVRAVDTSNNRDATPALYSWSVDAPPETTITSAVDRQGGQISNGGTTRSNVITFSFTGTDNLSLAGFECSLDGAAFTPCTSPITYLVKPGTHTFRVRAIDNNGFRDPTPAALTWTRR